MQLNDPPTAAQLAVAIERLVNLSEDVKEIRGSQKRLESAMVEVPLLKQEMEHLADSLRQLHTVAEVRSVAHHQLDKRVLILERWHKFMVAQPAIILTVALAAWGYWNGFTKSMDAFQDDTKQRVQTLEFIVNSPAYEKAMQSPPTATGKK
ncbi:hypothetical protein PT7_P036 (plasmid) [Pusillimonas sp. T7-7]|uniref:hypothetical protein n=1 Tax=Pusillimonas sp. (strain T7-7) TaxID=1007105 RepID=UPI0002084A9B|nr:hypothetical protein [Pusillimonas sp. T7-7]AEC22272.1 hypothetical protein PT7_P036 [Pusillimonas sp. T7-7]